jgi:hypothetical protein
MSRYNDPGWQDNANALLVHIGYCVIRYSKMSYHSCGVDPKRIVPITYENRNRCSMFSSFIYIYIYMQTFKQNMFAFKVEIILRSLKRKL